MVVIVIVVVVVSVVLVVVVVVVGLLSSDDAHRHPDEHAYDPFEQPFTCRGLLRLEHASHDKDVEACGGLQGRTAGNVEKASLVPARSLPVSLRDVEGNGCGCAVELLANAELAGGQSAIEQLPSPGVELQGDLVYVEGLMMEHLGSRC